MNNTTILEGENGKASDGMATIQKHLDDLELKAQQSHSNEANVVFQDWSEDKFKKFVFYLVEKDNLLLETAKKFVE